MKWGCGADFFPLGLLDGVYSPFSFAPGASKTLSPAFVCVPFWANLFVVVCNMVGRVVRELRRARCFRQALRPVKEARGVVVRSIASQVVLQSRVVEVQGVLQRSFERYLRVHFAGLQRDFRRAVLFRGNARFVRFVRG